MIKKKLLCWSDSSLAGTGFGVVSKYILTALYNTGLYDIHHLAINFHGDFADTSQVPWQQQPSRLLDPKDPHGIKMFQRTLAKTFYDLVWVCNDLYVTHEVADVIDKIKQHYIVNNHRPPIFIYYYPVDCKVPLHATGFLKAVDIPVCYTNHGKEETLKTCPELTERLRQIPHGVETDVFKPCSIQEINAVKNNILKVQSDKTVVINVNRNSARKQLQYSMLAFYEFRKYVPNSIMYIHTAAMDQGGDLLKTIAELGLNFQDDIILPTNYSPSNPAPVKTMNYLYNMGDIFLTTHLGEGFGLTIIEAMAAGVPVVAPDNTCMSQLLGEEGERGYIYPCNDMIYIDDSGFRKKGLIPDIVDMMMMAYNDGPKENNPTVANALRWAKQHDWNIITKAWINLFARAEEIAQVNSQCVIKEEL